MSWKQVLPTPFAIAIAAGTWYNDSKRNGALNQLNSRREIVNNQLMRMYAPLYGNRLIHSSNLKALEKKVGKCVNQHLVDICDKKDKDALENWRGFYRRSLSALDKDAEIVVLFGGDCFYDEETRLITEENYDSTDFQPEVNNIKYDIHKEFTDLITATFHKLVQERNDLDDQMKGSK
ncbi:Oidioi.mRNA.OKI2018_I69.XSR.g14600.t1.cds [Oikopleura dioica]|uniref:Oidioi.mRNA.OKI2018_I69.XSR.g14600.t1.cds n=1 Tax=Oikopleura dioica TaxID=34765 RepID=A0ABN7SAA8_OIKDI|nr:Oidioi.mRNA.OKI2018_I69.XSR.g14600.t1.cds [Oikopleura dioica]